MKRYFTACLFLICYAQNAICHDSTLTRSYIGVNSGIVRFYGLESFNQALTDGDIKAIKTTGASNTYNFICQIPKMDFQFDFSIIAVSNKTKKPAPQVNLNFYTFSFNIGYNLLSGTSPSRITPFVGISAPFTQLTMITHDSTITTTQLVGGAQNMYFEQPSIQAWFDAGVRFNHFFKNLNGNLGIALQATYSQQIGVYEWTIPDMPIRKLNCLNFSLSLLGRFPKQN